MTSYRRYFIPGGTYFFTVTLADRSSSLLTQNIAALRAAFRHVRTEMPFVVDAIVVLPDHLHTIWVLPPDDADFSTRWKKIKAAFSRQLPKIERRSESRTSKGERGIWQRRFWEHAVRNEAASFFNDVTARALPPSDLARLALVSAFKSSSVSVCPARCRCEAMGAPMTPRPTKPMRSPVCVGKVVTF